MEELLEKLMELAEMTKLTALIKEKKASNFISSWKPLLDIVLEIEKKGRSAVGICWLDKFDITEWLIYTKYVKVKTAVIFSTMLERLQS